MITSELFHITKTHRCYLLGSKTSVFLKSILMFNRMMLVINLEAHNIQEQQWMEVQKTLCHAEALSLHAGK